MSEDDLTATRRAKLATLRAEGFAYPNDFSPEDHAGEVLATHENDDKEALERIERNVVVAGRVMAKRSFGKAAFAVIEDASGRIQTYLRKDQLDEETFKLVKSLDLGDRIGVRGTVFRTRTNELTISATEMRLLAKCLHPLPEKWHGLTDVEIRYRQRYLDLLANAEVRHSFEKRAKVLAGIRAFLTERDYLEVETPILQSIAGGAAAKPFLTHHNALDMSLQLRIAPELYLKRLLVGGFERVFEIGRNFRNEGVSTRHNPEFTMLEFYQSYATVDDLLPLVEEMIIGLAETLHGTTKLPYGDDEIDLAGPWRRLSLLDATAERVGCAAEDLRSDARAAEIAKKQGVEPPAGAGAGKITTELFEHLFEAELVQPTFVLDFPREVSPLSRPRDGDPWLVDRFELYAVGREMANGFSELNDPEDQRERFAAQVASRARGDEEAHPMDEDYVTALEYGMPPAAGCGVGIDRLVMLLCNLPSIRDAILFPLLRAERSQ